MSVSNYTPDPGTLYIVATPIGNLGDLSPRARELLAGVDIIACEDTRRSGLLLKHYNINTRLLSLHEHNESGRVQEVLGLLASSRSVALISDAGTPLISDPGYVLVSKAREEGFPVTAVPGPSAIIAALSVAGLATDSFVFAGFVSSKAGARKSQLEALLQESRTSVVYESPRRILQTLELICELAGPGRRVVVARELTKLYETVISAPVAEVLEKLRSDENQQKGEFVLLIEGNVASGQDELSQEAKDWINQFKGELPDSALAKKAAKVTGISRQLIYDYILSLKE